MSDDDRDPLDEPHPRARELMPDDALWDRTDAEAPFGSEAGDTAYAEFRAWREENPDDPLIDCLDWILGGRLAEYTRELCLDTAIARDVANPKQAFLAGDFDMFTLDATVIATGLGQLVDEGRIDPDAKPYIQVALSRQLHPQLVISDRRRRILEAVQRAVAAA